MSLLGWRGARSAAALAALVAWCLSNSSPLAAQYTVPVALVHGYAEDPAVFSAMGSDLQNHFSPRILELLPSLASGSSISYQADQLRSYLGAWTYSTLAVAHSNGGLVARRMAGLQPGAGPRAIVTFGTPHSGVPGVNHLNDAWWYYTFLGWDIDAAVATATDLFTFNRRLSGFALTAIATAGTVAAIQGVPLLVTEVLNHVSPTQAIFDDVKPGAGLLEWLNHNPSSGLADYYVPARVGIVVTTRNYSVGGPLRLRLPPAWATELGHAVYFASSASMIVGSNLYDDTIGDEGYLGQDLYDRQLDLAVTLMALGAQGMLADTQWCWWITGGYSCPPNDAFIPVERQYYPWSGGDDYRPVEIDASHSDEPSDGELIGAVRAVVQRVITERYPY
jgi:hypothetical protein